MDIAEQKCEKFWTLPERICTEIIIHVSRNLAAEEIKPWDVG